MGIKYVWFEKMNRGSISLIKINSNQGIAIQCCERIELVQIKELNRDSNRWIGENKSRFNSLTQANHCIRPPFSFWIESNQDLETRLNSSTQFPVKFHRNLRHPFITPQPPNNNYYRVKHAIPPTNMYTRTSAVRPEASPGTHRTSPYQRDPEVPPNPNPRESRTTDYNQPRPKTRDTPKSCNLITAV